MTISLVFIGFSFCFLLLTLYFFHLLLFVRKEKRGFEKVTDFQKYVLMLENKRKRTHQKRKKNYYLYLICLSLVKAGNCEKALRLAPFLRRDRLLNVSKDFMKEKGE